jgi:mRNA-degrading endonuclease RelE of RelBE toxin-antitoxin system
MRYHLEIKEEARQQLRALAKEQRRNVGRRLDALQNRAGGAMGAREERVGPRLTE